MEYLQGYWDHIRFVTTINERDGVIVLGSSRNVLMATIKRDKLNLLKNHGDESL